MPRSNDRADNGADDGRPQGDGARDRISRDLSDREIRQVEERLNPNAAIVHEVIRAEGQEELRRPVGALAWSGFAAGLSIGFSLVADGLLRAGLPDEPWRPLISSFGYAFGFLIVVLGRQQLFTENTLTAVLPWLHDRNWTQFGLLLRLWAVVFATNIAGTLAFAAALAWTEPFPPEAHRAFVEIGREAAAPAFLPTFATAVFAGWLIALMVWMIPASGSAKVLVIIIVTYVVGLADLAHVIAGSAEVGLAAMEGAVGWGEYLWGFLLPSFLGNTLGGVVLVSIVNHAQTQGKLREKN